MNENDYNMLPHSWEMGAEYNQPELGQEGLPGFLAEESTFPRNTQKTDPLGDNFIMPGDMRYLYEPPKQLPFPLDKLYGINKYLFGDPETRWQQQQDEVLNKQKMEKQLKEEELQQRYRDFRKETEDILLQYRKPTDYIDKPDPLLNPYKENDPSVDMNDSLFRSPMPQDIPENYPKLAQGGPSLRGRQPSDDPYSELRMPHSLSETGNFRIPDTENVRDMLRTPPQTTEEMLAMYDPGGGLGGLPAGIMKYGPNVTNLADIAKSPYSKLFDTLNRQTHRTYWTNEIPMDVSTPAIIKGKKLPFYEEYRDIPGTGGYSMDPENFKLAGLQAEGHPSGSIIATRGNERDAGTLQHEMMHNVIDLTARDKPFPDIDPAREAKSERMLEAIYGKSEHDKDTLRGTTSSEIGRAFKEISDEKLRKKVYDEIGSRYSSKVRGDRDRYLAEELMAFSASQPVPTEGLDRMMGSGAEALSIRNDLKRNPVLEGLFRESEGAILPHMYAVPDWTKAGEATGKQVPKIPEGPPKRIPIDDFTPAPPPRGFPGAAPEPMPVPLAPTLPSTPGSLFEAVTRGMGFHPSTLDKYDRGEVTKVMDFLMKNPEATLPGVIEAWKAGTLFPKPAPWWKRVMGG